MVKLPVQTIKGHNSLIYMNIWIKYSTTGATNYRFGQKQEGLGRFGRGKDQIEAVVLNGLFDSDFLLALQ